MVTKELIVFRIDINNLVQFVVFPVTYLWNLMQRVVFLGPGKGTFLDATPANLRRAAISIGPVRSYGSAQRNKRAHQVKTNASSEIIVLDIILTSQSKTHAI
jgi:hypothetical protein